MAKARGSAPNPPAQSEEESESEEVKENGGSGSESATESETDKSQSTKKPSSTPAKKSLTPKPTTPDTSSGEAEFGSDYPSDPNIKPIASKPSAATKLRSKPNSSSAAGVKRPAGGDGQGKETKRLKKKPEKYVEESEKKKGTTNDESRKLFRRLWSENDEIAILNGMIDFSAKKKVDPFTNLDSFHDFIKKSLHVDVTRTQLQDKIRRLRKRYNNNAAKEKKAKVLVFPKDHEQKAFELSKKVWGKDNSTAGGKKLESPKFNGQVVRRRSRSGSKNTNTNAKTPVNEGNDEEVKNSDGGNGLEPGMKFVNLNGGLEPGMKFGLGKTKIEEWIMDNIHFVDAEKRAKMDDKWKNFKMVEAEFYVKKLELMLQETNLVLDALKSSSS